jgi:putative ABC transport system permease protein
MRPEHWIYTIPLRLRSLFRWAQADQELDDELRDHLERATEEYVAKGMGPEEARRRARLDLGGVEKVKEECRDARRVNVLENLWQDLRFGARILVKSPAFTFFVVSVLALGIAANTAIFSIADAIFIRPLPYRDADRLVMIWEDASAFGFPKDQPAPGDFYDWKTRNQVFEDAAAIPLSGFFNLAGDGNPEELNGKSVTANLFSVLGVKPALGRDFRPEDDVPGAPHVAVLSHGLWLRRFGGDPQIIGKEISLNGEKCTVIGVMGRGLEFPRLTDIWVPAGFTKDDLANHGSHYLIVIGRLKPGITLKTANANLSVIAKALEKEHPNSNTKIGAFAVPLRQELSGDVRPAILMLVGAVCFVLLIACANVANLLLSRAAGRRRELAVRFTLGASRSRIVQQMLTESVLLAFLAGGLGLVLSIWGTKVLSTLIPRDIAPATAAGVNDHVLLFTLVVSLATGIFFGIIPASRVSQFHIAPSVQQGGRGSVGSGAHRLRGSLVICEVALATVLLTGASLLIRSLENLYHLDPGFRADHVLVMRTSLPYPKYQDPIHRTAFYDRVLDQVKILPGVVAAGYTSWVPLTNAGGATSITIDGKPEPEPSKLLIPNIRIINKDYIATLRMKLIEGRLLDQRDGAGALLVALVNQTMAKNYWSGEDPVGRRFKIGTYNQDSPWITVVGIVGDVHQAGFDAPVRAEMYLPYQQQTAGYAPKYLAVRTSGDPILLAEPVRQIIWSVDREQPIADVMPLEQLVDQDLASRKMQASLLGSFAGFALLLVMLGIYAVLSFAVAQRTQEIGVRLALGAQPGQVLRMMFAQGFKLFLMGAVIGLGAALALSRALVHSLFNVSAYDPASFAGVTVLLGAVALLACYIPARRAMRVDPMVALRYE